MKELSTAISYSKVNGNIVYEEVFNKLEDGLMSILRTELPDDTPALAKKNVAIVSIRSVSYAEMYKNSYLYISKASDNIPMEDKSMVPYGIYGGQTGIKNGSIAYYIIAYYYIDKGGVF